MGNNDSKEPRSYDVTPAGAASSEPSKEKPKAEQKEKKEEPAPEKVERRAKTVQKVVCDYNELKDGEMKEVEVEGQKVLLARDKGTYYAVSSKCTHFGAPLAKGALCNGRVRCPWHGACFSLATGDIEDFPGLDSLETFDVEVTDGKVAITADSGKLSSTKRVKSMMRRDLECTLLYLIIGGGPAALECAESLRQNGYKGKILMITMETDPPYDRTKLSKSLNATGAELALRNKEFYDAYHIHIMTGMEAFKISTEMNHAVFKGGEYTDYTVEYDQVAICTGSRPTRLAVPGVATFKKDVFYLRSPSDGNAIINRAAEKNIVIIGTSFIGMEVAAALVSKAKSVTVVGRSNLPFINSLGEKVGTILYNLFQSKGVKFEMNAEIEELIGNEESLAQIKLKNGETIPADIIVVGMGVEPNTDWLKDSGLNLGPKGHILVNKFNKTNVDNVFAAGDCTSFPLFLTGSNASIGHFQMALAHGRNAGLSMCLKEEPLRSVPFFWTAVFGKSVRYCGHHSPSDEVIFHGDDNKFLAFYARNEKIVAVASLAWDPAVAVVAELMYADITIPVDNIRSDPEGFKALLPK